MEEYTRTFQTVRASRFTAYIVCRLYERERRFRLTPNFEDAAQPLTEALRSLLNSRHSH